MHSRQHSQLRCFQQHSQIPVLGVEAFKLSVYDQLAETLGRFLEYDRAPWPQMGASRAAGCEAPEHQ